MPCAPALQAVARSSSHPQVLASEIIVENKHPVAGPLRQARVRRPLPRHRRPSRPAGRRASASTTTRSSPSSGSRRATRSRALVARGRSSEPSDTRHRATRERPGLARDASRGAAAMSTAVVIGADRGIAHAIARQLHERGDNVIAACLSTATTARPRPASTVERRRRRHLAGRGRQVRGHARRAGHPDSTCCTTSPASCGSTSSARSTTTAWPARSRSTRSGRCARSRRCATCSAKARRSAS